MMHNPLCIYDSNSNQHHILDSLEMHINLGESIRIFDFSQFLQGIKASTNISSRCQSKHRLSKFWLLCCSWDINRKFDTPYSHMHIYSTGSYTRNTLSHISPYIYNLVLKEQGKEPYTVGIL